jgi:hypothetical protein
MSDYADALRDRLPLDQVLHRAYAEEQPVYLPAVVPAPVYQPVLLPEAVPLIGPGDVRLVAVGLCGLCSGGGVFLVCAGIHMAGPYLWPAAGLVGSVAMLIALVKSKTIAPSGGTQVTISGGKNRIGSIR